MSDGMTQAEYARHRNVSRQAISKLIKAGKIPVSPDGLIDPAEADFRLGENRLRVNIHDDADEATPVSRLPAEGAGLTKARTATEVYRARIAQLEFEERVGKLVRIVDIERSMERCAEALVRDIDQLPTVADDVAAAFARGGVAAVRDALKAKACALRDTLSRSMRLLAAEPEEVEKD